MFNLPQDLPKLKIPDRTRHVTEFGWLITTEAAGYLTVKPRTLLSWVRQGKIRAYALSGVKRRIWRFRKADLDAALLQRSTSMLCSAPPSVLVTKGEGK
jgi:excisionase family DNA binding protein